MTTNSLSYGGVLTQPHRVGPSDLDLSIIVPTRNEAGNIDVLVTRIENAFGGGSTSGPNLEVIFVDDRPRNIAAADAIGMATILFNPTPEDSQGHTHPTVRTLPELKKVLADSIF